MKIFSSTTELAAATLTADQIVKVKSVGDYRIQDSGTGITLANGKIAVPQASGTAISVKQFGATGDGVTDDTAALQAAIDAASNGFLHIPSGSYSCNTLTLSSPIKIEGSGTLNLITAATTLLYITANNCEIDGLTLVGSGNSAEQLTEILVRTGPSTVGSTSTVVENLQIRNCTIKDSDGYACRLAYIKDSVIDNCVMDNLRYAGVFVVSGSNIKVVNCKINNITGLSSNNNAYGITFTRDKLISVAGGGDRSSNCSAINNTISNVDTWNGLDTHGGIDITFANNRVIDCGFPIGIVASEEPGPIYIGADNVTVTGNIIDSSGTSGTNDQSITLAGEATSYNTNVVFSNNTVKEVGEKGQSLGGAVRFYNSTGTVVSGNIILNPRAIGINIWYANDALAVTGNVVIDPYDDTVTTASGICLRSTDNIGYIGGNSCVATGASLGTYTAERGIYIVTGTNNDITIGTNFSNYATPTNGYGNLSSDLNVAELTDSTGGAANSTLQDVSATYNQTFLNNNFADLAAKVNQIIRILELNNLAS